MKSLNTLPAFTLEEREEVHSLLGAKVASMMGRKFEEGDWAEIYCQAKRLPNKGWSNLKLDVIHHGLGVEHKMLCYKSKVDITEACGKTLMHPSATRSFRMPPTTTEPQEAMRIVLTQYAEFIEARFAEVRKSLVTDGEPDMRTGWLLWQESLRQFLYFEQEMLAPDPDDYNAKWVTRASGGARKGSTNLWVYENATGVKRYSITSEAGAKIQPYFDVPPPADPNLYVFTVIGEVIDAGLVRVWITEATARELERLLGNLDVAKVSDAILKAIQEIEELEDTRMQELEAAQPILITKEAYEVLKTAIPGVSDEHSLQLLAQFMRRRN